MSQQQPAKMPQATVTCIKWGNKFPAYYVNRLYAGVKRHMDRPFRFVCFTENAEGLRPEVEVFPLPVVAYEDAMVRAMTTGKRRGSWRKVTIFQPGKAELSGPCLQLDLDVVITGPLGPLIDHAPGKVCMGRDWLERRRHRPGGHGSAVRFDPHLHRYLFDGFGEYITGEMQWKGEQKYTSMTALTHGDLEYFPEGWICSFKRQSIPVFPLNFLRVPVLPDDCRVMCFHGTPKMEEALVGDCPKLRYRTRPAAWLRDLWLDANEKDWMPG
ncbi:MAG: hypothetical protein KDJ48_16400 [Nitratireductor sp.]|nr:hypothetical protein [Nitratireductor sp.]